MFNVSLVCDCIITERSFQEDSSTQFSLSDNMCFAYLTVSDDLINRVTNVCLLFLFFFSTIQLAIEGGCDLLWIVFFKSLSR